MNSTKAKETNTVWTKLIPKDSKPRYGHSSTYYDNHSIDYCVYNVFGSDEKGNFCGDIFKFNLADEKVEKIETNFARHFHTATLFEDRIYIFGAIHITLGDMTNSIRGKVKWIF
jgi:hypothetical protein